MAVKKQIMKLDLDEEVSPFEGFAFLLFHTATPNYAFVDDLNHLYELALARTDDIEIMGEPWSMFTYRDPLWQLTYHLIERPSTAATGVTHWGPAEKLLMIKGLNADEIATHICDDFTASHPTGDRTDSRDADHAAILEYYQQSLTAVTLYDPLDQQPASKKAAKERAELEALLADIADSLDLAGQ